MKSSRSVSIVDVAKKAGLSPTTVSRVINKNGYFSDETMRKVESAIEELGYRPNWIARSLKGKPSKLIGLIIPDIANVFYTSVAHDASSALRKLGYDMILCVSDESPEKDLSYLQILDEKRVDGIIYTHPAFGCNPDYIHKLSQRWPADC
jgi:DNA-binding LacI/PurR family transcriptional regulator